MPRSRSSANVVTLAILALALAGCERGCLARWLGESGVGGVAPEGAGGAAPRGKTRNLGLEGTDCSDGLLRCVGGDVEASRARHLPYPCGATKRGENQPACACPWEVIARCATGCASEGLEAIGEPSDAGAAQLCRPDAPIARPVLPGDPIPDAICTTEGVACVDGIVRACEAPGHTARALATCLHGCASHVGIDAWVGDDAVPGAPKDPDGVVSILCRRDHAERR
ncbi:MAG: hypothetical protein KF795_26350 [Labilithrix sp.]|nr:hypothetical protein [Labilithrix sp.]